MAKESNWRSNYIALGCDDHVPPFNPPKEGLAARSLLFPTRFITNLADRSNAFAAVANSALFSGVVASFQSVAKPNGANSAFPYGFLVTPDHPRLNEV